MITDKIREGFKSKHGFSVEEATERVSDRADKLVGVCPCCESPVRKTCECGANTSCTKEGCHYGSGQYPCECHPAKPSGLKQVW